MERKGYTIPSITSGLETAAKDINQGFQSLKPAQPPIQSPQPIQPVQQVQQVQPPLPLPEDPFISKFKKWMLVILTILVGGLAVGAIIWRIMLRFVG